MATLLVLRSRGATPSPDPVVFQALRDAPLDPRSPSTHAAAGAREQRAPLPFPAAAGLGEAGRAALVVVEEVERGHDGGAWSVARKRFDPCPGEDVERIAWIDVWSRIVKLTGWRAGADDVAIEQWFDRDGRLRGVRASGGGRDGWSSNALLDERGSTVHQAATGAPPSLEALGLTRKDPSTAFFEKPRCVR